LKEYLLAECANVEQTLHESLRYRYHEKTATEYYNECGRRLKTIQRYVASANNDFDLQAWRSQLSVLSTLITHIERSHLEEFSWPFADALERVARSVCARANAEMPLFFFMAQGKFADYAVRYDETTENVRKRDIYSVFFPRTLKDQVLLHSIFGHEIGHAALAAQPQTAEALSQLRDDSILADVDALYEWCQKHLHVQDKVSRGYLKKQADSWSKEIFCDLFGLIMIGPAFIPAFTTLIEPSYQTAGFDYVPSHPPYPTRIVVLLHAARALGMCQSGETGGLPGIAKMLDDNFEAKVARYEGTPYAFLSKANVERATQLLAEFMGAFEGPLRCPVPDGHLIGQLVDVLLQKIPPASPRPLLDGADLSAVLPIDFRHILYAGWIGWSRIADPKAEEFPRLNRYCAHAILQQEGVFYWNATTSKTA
jgi:hypothetical protein